MATPHLFYLTDRNGENPQRLLTIVDLTAIEAAFGDKADRVHAHVVEEVTGLRDLLADKADVVHTHVIADINGLQIILDGKAASEHFHSIGDVAGLQATLNGHLPIDFTSYLVSNVAAGYDESDTDRFTVNVTWVYLDPAQNYPEQTFVNPIPIASDDRAGLMSKSDVVQLRSVTSAVESLQNQGVFVGVSFATKADLDAYEIPSEQKVNNWTTVQSDETKEGLKTRYVIVNIGTDNDPILEFAFERIILEDPIGLAQTGVAGLVVGAVDNGQNAGKGYIETDGTTSVIGWNILNARVEGHFIDTSNPHGVTKNQVGLGNVDNTADAVKPISSAVQAEFNNRALKDFSNVTGVLPVANGGTGKTSGKPLFFNGVTTNGDFNDFTEPGTYYLQGSETANAPAWWTVNSFSQLMVICGGTPPNYPNNTAGAMIQLAFGTGGQADYRRHLNGTWFSWLPFVIGGQGRASVINEDIAANTINTGRLKSGAYPATLENNTWTPSFGGSMSDGVVSSYSHRNGNYYRVGKLVYLFAQINATFSTNPSGVIMINGNPFTPMYGASWLAGTVGSFTGHKTGVGIRGVNMTVSGEINVVTTGVNGDAGRATWENVLNGNSMNIAFNFVFPANLS